MADIRIVWSVATILVAALLHITLRQYFIYKIRKYMPRTVSTIPVGTALTFGILFLVFVVLISIWGVSVENLWIYLTSVLGLIAIGFFAVWSILSNLLAGVVLLATKKLRRGDEVVILPEKVRGKVKEVSLMFVTLRQGPYTINVPNNLFFQRFTKVKPRK